MPDGTPSPWPTSTLEHVPGLAAALAWSPAVLHGLTGVACLVAWQAPGVIGPDRVLDLVLITAGEVVAAFLTVLFAELYDRDAVDRVRGAIGLIAGLVFLGLVGTTVLLPLGRTYLFLAFLAQLALHWLSIAPALRRYGADHGPGMRAAVHLGGIMALMYGVGHLDLAPIELPAGLIQATATGPMAGELGTQAAYTLLFGTVYFVTLGTIEAILTFRRGGAGRGSHPAGRT